MASQTFYKLLRRLRSICFPITTVVGLTLILTYVFILYRPGRGPGLVQKLGWQSWEVISVPTSTNKTAPATQPPHNHGVDWWNVTTPDASVDPSSLPLDMWAPLLPHDTGLSEITVTHCMINPSYSGGYCAPDSTIEQDAIRGTWVRVPRNLNREGSYVSGWLELYYRRTRRQDINLINEIRLYPKNEKPETTGDGRWHQVQTSLRSGLIGIPPLFLWYKTGKTGADMTPNERGNIITELDVLYGEDIPWYGFEKLEPATLPQGPKVEATWITYRRGVKIPPRATPLHFSWSGKFKILQVADLHFSVSQGVCRDTNLKPCDHSDNLTSTLIYHIIHEEKPDLIVFTGDQLNGQGTSWDAKSVLAKFAKAAIDHHIPWAAVFGNHDMEDGLARVHQMALMKGLPYSLVETGPRDIHGVGNYVLKVFSPDASKTHILTLYFLDSGSYAEGILDWLGFVHSDDFDWIHQSQIDWFLQESASINAIERPFHPDTGKDLGDTWRRQSDQIPPTSRKLAKPNALMFFHIPLQETFLKPDMNPLTGKPLDVGISGQQRAGNSKHNDGFFEKGVLKALESEHVAAGRVPEVKVIGNGHDHITENCRRIKGVWSCFGGGGSYSGYGKVGFDRRFRIYEISEFGETIRTYKRTEKDEIIDDMVLAGKGAPPIS